MQDDMVNIKKFNKSEDDIYSDFYNSGKTFVQVPQDESIRVGFSQRQVDFFKEWEVCCTVINQDGLTVIMKLQNEKYFPIIVKLFYNETNSLPYSVEQVL